MPELQVQTKIINVKPLSNAEFAPFGKVLENPGTNNDDNSSHAAPALVNQGTALLYSDISPVITRYHESSNHFDSMIVMSLFSCLPRQLEKGADLQDILKSRMVEGLLDLSVLERHPYTTQTFIPLGLDRCSNNTKYLVVVAPVKLSPPAEAGMPDISSIQAFLGRGSQGVTYGVGTWHAPMIVIGDSPVDFVVLQYKNQVAQDDCEEIELVPIEKTGIQIAVPRVKRI